MTYSDLNAEFNNLLNNTNSLISPFTAAVAAGGFKLTGLGAGTSLTDAASVTQVQDGFGSYLTSVAGTNTVTGTATPTPAYAVGQRFTFIPAVTNTGAATLNISSVGAGAVQWLGAALTGGEMVAATPITVVVTATTPVFEIINPRIAAKADVAAHATTSNPWVASQIVLTGVAVTFTDIQDAPYVGAVVWVKQNAAHVWTDGAVFSVQGDANYTAAAGDWVRVYATTVSTFEVTIFRATGAPVSMAPITASLSGNVALNNVASYFDGPSVAQGTVGTWFASGTVTISDTVAASFSAKLWDGTTVIASAGVNTSGANERITMSLSGFIASPVGNIRISVKDVTSVNGTMYFNDSGNSKDSTITAIRVA